MLGYLLHVWMLWEEVPEQSILRKACAFLLSKQDGERVTTFPVKIR